MRNIMMPMLLLAAVALSTGVVLPRLPCQQHDAAAIPTKSSSDSHNQVTECDVLRRLFRSRTNWLFDTENNQEKYNENFNKEQGFNTHEHEPEAEWFGYQKQFPPRNFERDYFSDGDSYAQDQNWGYEQYYEPPQLPTINTHYSQNKDILIRDGQAYYLYDMYMTATSPLDYIQNPHNRHYKAILRSLSNNEQPTDKSSLKLQEERETINTNEINPLAEQVVNKRNDIEEIGEKELLNDLVVNEEDTGEVHKKLFSFWSRLQALSHKGRQLPTRRHTFVFYGPDGTRDGPLTAETLLSQQVASYLGYNPTLKQLRGEYPNGEKAVLYSFWASSCSWRVRAALTAKRVPFEERVVDIVKQKAQKTASYRAICPSQKVPAIVIDGQTLVESMAILQYLEDTRPHPSLAPASPLLKARMREIVETIVSGIQPLQNVGLRGSFDDKEQYTKFARQWTARGLETLEDLLSRSSRAGKYCVGDQLTLADICLVPQVYNAAGRHIDINKYPTVSKLYEELLKDDVFVNSHPENVKKSTK